ncbi:MAG: hypothetical protein ACI8UO_005687 [Verrucomicrobiales bacterium]|jgi:hypothetical protein
MSKLPIVLILAISALVACQVSANSFTPFVENMEIGETATRFCNVVPSGFDEDWEYFTLIVHSDGGAVFGVRGRAKPGAVKLDPIHEAGGSIIFNVTAKLLKRTFHESKNLVNIEVQIERVEAIQN